MRVKLSEKYKNERENICKKLINIIELDENNSFFLYKLDADIEKQQKIMDMKEEIRKYFAVSTLSAFKPEGFECKRPYMSILRSILRKQGYEVKNRKYIKLNPDGTYIRTIKYKILRN
jgi:hypothetical protein